MRLLKKRISSFPFFQYFPLSEKIIVYIIFGLITFDLTINAIVASGVDGEMKIFTASVLLSYISIYGASILFHRNKSSLSFIGPLLLTTLIIEHIFMPSILPTTFLWFFSYPLTIYFLAGKKMAVYWIIFLIMISGVILILSYFKIIDIPYSQELFLNALIVMAFIAAILFLHQQEFEYFHVKRIEHSDTLFSQINKERKEKNLIQNRLQSFLLEVREQNKQLTKTKRAMLNILEDTEEDRNKLSVILESIGDGVLVLDANRNIALINSAVSKISGFSTKEIEGHQYNETLVFLNESDRKENTIFIDNIFLYNAIIDMPKHIVLRHKDGHEIPVSDSASPILDDSGKAIGCVIVFRDTTREREIDRMKSEFISVASHQLRTPLTGIRWFIEMLAEKDSYDLLSSSQKKMIDSIKKSTSRMIMLVNDLLDVSRIESEFGFALEKKHVDIVQLIKDVIRWNTISSKRYDVRVKIDKSFPPSLILNIDETKIKDIFDNLILNAIKYSISKGEVIVGFQKTKSSIIFSIKDNGLGIPEDSKHRVFEKFFRARNVTLLETEGSGLGLYISKAFIEKHDGTISFESEEKKGTTFYISLPKKVLVE